MDLNRIVNKAKTLATEGVSKAKQYASENSDTVNNGLNKAEAFVNDKTGGKYSDKLAKGREGLTNALGVPGDARQAYDDARNAAEKASGPVTPDPIKTSPIDDIQDIDKPRPI